MSPSRPAFSRSKNIRPSITSKDGAISSSKRANVHKSNIMSPAVWVEVAAAVAALHQAVAAGPRAFRAPEHHPAACLQACPSRWDAVWGHAALLEPADTAWSTLVAP